MQKVDPFIPVRKQSQAPRRPLPSRPSPHSGHSVDGFVSRPSSSPRPLPHLQPIKIRPRPVPPQSNNTPPPPPPPPPPKTYNPPRPSSTTEAFSKAERQLTAQDPRKSNLRKIITVFLQATALILLFGLGFLLRSIIVGQVIIILYAIFAFIFRIESRTTFIFVLISFGVVLTASLRSDTALASVFAVYAFLLLIVGTISLSREVRNEV